MSEQRAGPGEKVNFVRVRGEKHCVCRTIFVFFADVRIVCTHIRMRNINSNVRVNYQVSAISMTLIATMVSSPLESSPNVLPLGACEEVVLMDHCSPNKTLEHMTRKGPSRSAETHPLFQVVCLERR